MNNDIKKLIFKYIGAGVQNILLENVSKELFKESVVLDSSSDISLLNGHYEGEEFCPPKWYEQLCEKSNPLLIIENINEIELKEQKKFMEILKYRKVSTFDLPDNCVVILICKDLKEKQINEDIYSLLVHIK